MKKWLPFLLLSLLVVASLARAPAARADQYPIQNFQVGTPYEPTIRNFVNNALMTVATLFSGPSAPPNPKVGWMWFNSTSNAISVYGADLAWHVWCLNAATGCTSAVLSGANTLPANQFANAINSSGTLSGRQPTEADLSLSNVTTNDTSIARHGFAPLLPNDSTKFLNGTGGWAAPVLSGNIPAGPVLHAVGVAAPAASAPCQTAACTLDTYSLPANTLGTVGEVDVSAAMTYTNTTTADNINIGIMYGTTPVAGALPTATPVGSNIPVTLECRIHALGATNAESVFCRSWVGNSTGIFHQFTATMAEDSTVAKNLTITFQDSATANGSIKLFNVTTVSGSGGAVSVGANSTLQQSTGAGTFKPYPGSTLGAHQFANSIDPTGTLGGAQPAEADLNITDNVTANTSATAHGFAPKLPADPTKFLNGNGLWAAPPGGGGAGIVHDYDVVFANNTTSNSSTTMHGYLPILDGNATHFLRGDGSWQTPPGTGGGGGAAGPVLHAIGGNPAVIQAAALNTIYTLDTFTVPGSTLGTVGEIDINAGLTYTNTNSEAPTIGIQYGSTSLSGQVGTIAAGANVPMWLQCALHTLGSATLQDARCRLYIGSNGLYHQFSTSFAENSANPLALAITYQDTVSAASTVKLFDVTMVSGSGGAVSTGASGVLQSSNGSGGFGAYGGAGPLAAHTFANQLSASGALTGAQPADSDLAFSDNTTSNVSTTAHGYAPKAPGNTAQYLDGSGHWSTPGAAGGNLVTSVNVAGPMFSGASVTNPSGSGAATITGPASFSQGPVASATIDLSLHGLNQMVQLSGSGTLTFANLSNGAQFTVTTYESSAGAIPTFAPQSGYTLVWSGNGTLQPPADTTAFHYNVWTFTVVGTVVVGALQAPIATPTFAAMVCTTVNNGPATTESVSACPGGYSLMGGGCSATSGNITRDSVQPGSHFQGVGSAWDCIGTGSIASAAYCCQ